MLKYVLRIRNLIFTNIEEYPWFKDVSYISRVVICLKKTGWLKYINYLKLGDQAPQAIATSEELVVHSQNWGEYSLDLLNQSDLPVENKNQPFAVSLYPRYQSLDFILTLNSDFERTHSDISVSTISQLVCCLHNEFGEDALFGPEVRLRLNYESYPRLWPPRYIKHLTFGNLIDFFSHRYFQNERKYQEEIEHILKAPTPDGIRSWWNSNDLRAIQWVNNLLDKDHLLERRALQERWLIDLVAPPVESSFAHLVSDEGKEEDAYLTYYQKLGYNNGYLLIKVNPDGSFDKELVAQLVKWKQEKQLPDGRKIRDVFLIVQNLKAALQIYNQVLTMGIDDIFYLE